MRSADWKHALLLQAIMLLGMNVQASSVVSSFKRSRVDHIQETGRFAAGVVRNPRADQLNRSGPFSPESFRRRPVPGARHVIVYGGSVVAGSGIEKVRDMFVTRLGGGLTKRLGERFISLNAGQGGYTTHHAVRGLLIGRHIERFKPRLLIVMTGYNECSREAPVTLRAITAKALMRRSSLLAPLTQAPLSRLLGRAAATLMRPRVKKGKVPFVEQVPLAHGRDNLLRFVRKARREGVPVLLSSEATWPYETTYPMRDGYSDTPGRGHRCRGRHRALQQHLARTFSHVGYVGVAEWFSKNGSASLFGDMVHYNEKGSRLVARLLLEHVIRVWPGRDWLVGRSSLDEVSRRKRLVVMPTFEGARSR